MDVEEVTTSEGLEALREPWQRLERTDPFASYYLTHRFVQAWWEAFRLRSGVALLVLVLRHNGEVVAIAPLSIRRETRQGETRTVLRFATHGDYTGVLLDPAHHPDTLLRALLRRLEADPAWDRIGLNNIPSTSPLTAHLLKGPYNPSLRYHVENPYIDLTRYRDFDDFEARSAPSKARKYRNKLHRERDVAFRVLHGDEDGILDRLADLHRREKTFLIAERGRSERHSLYDDEARFAHIRRVFETTDDAVTFAYEDADGALVGYRTCFAHGRTLLSWNSAYAPEYDDYRIGKVLQYDILRHLFAEGSCDVFDLGAGRYPWKFEWTSTFTTSYRLQVRLDTATGQSGPSGAAARPARPQAQAGRAQQPGEPGRGDAERPAGSSPAATGLAAARALARRAGLGRLKRAALALRRRLAAPVVWYVPHPDDETLFMGASLYRQRRRRNLVVVLTQGGASKALETVNAKLEAPLDREAFMRGRARELRAALRALHVAEDDVHLLDLPDGGVTEEAVAAVIAEMARAHPRASHRTMSYLDPHPDHAAAGRALRAAHDRGEVAEAVFHLPVPLVDERRGEAVAFAEAGMARAKRAAIREYERWEPEAGRYAIGGHSVASLMREQYREPAERVHGPDVEP